MIFGIGFYGILCFIILYIVIGAVMYSPKTQHTSPAAPFLAILGTMLFLAYYVLTYKD